MSRVQLDIELSDLRERLGLSEDQLPDDATPEKVAEVMKASAKTEEHKKDDEKDDEEEKTDHKTDQPDTTAKVPNDKGSIVVDAAVFRRMEDAIGRQDRLEKRLNQQDRDEMLTAAVNDGKFPPSRKPHYEQMFDADPDGTKELIARLHKDIVPVSERGSGGLPDIVDDDNAYPSDWLPEVSARKAGADSGRRVVVGGD